MQFDYRRASERNVARNLNANSFFGKLVKFCWKYLVKAKKSCPMYVAKFLNAKYIC